MKPREFTYIFENGGDPILMREVIPIDWEILRYGMEAEFGYITDSFFIKIKELVEKQLAGETGIKPVEGK